MQIFTTYPKWKILPLDQQCRSTLSWPTNESLFTNKVKLQEMSKQSSLRAVYRRSWTSFIRDLITNAQGSLENKSCHETRRWIRKRMSLAIFFHWEMLRSTGPDTCSRLFTPSLGTTHTVSKPSLATRLPKAVVTTAHRKVQVQTPLAHSTFRIFNYPLNSSPPLEQHRKISIWYKKFCRFHCT